MPKIYYRCSKCHSKIKTKLINIPDLTLYDSTRWFSACFNCKKLMRVYKCQHNYWWELLYMKIRTYIRIFVNTLKIIRDSWRVFLQYERDYYKIEKTLKEWSKK